MDNQFKVVNSHRHHRFPWLKQQTHNIAHCTMTTSLLINTRENIHIYGSCSTIEFLGQNQGLSYFRRFRYWRFEEIYCHLFFYWHFRQNLQDLYTVPWVQAVRQNHVNHNWIFTRASLDITQFSIEIQQRTPHSSSARFASTTYFFFARTLSQNPH